MLPLPSSIVLFATMSMVSPVRRLKYTPGLGLVSHNMGGQIHPAAIPLRVSMQVAAPFGETTRNSSPNAQREGFPNQRWKAQLHDFGVSDAVFSPIVINEKIARQLLFNWAALFVNPFEDLSVDPLVSLQEDDGLRQPPKAPKYRNDEKAMVLHAMKDFNMKVMSIYETVGKLRKIRPHIEEPTIVAQLSRRDRMRLNLLLFCENLEMVGLIPENLESPSLASDPSAAEASVLAVGVLSRAQVQDDSSGSLHQRMRQALSGAWFSSSATPAIDVFAIEGIADAPGPSRSARVLLSKIHKYAVQEQKLVVLSKRAYTSVDGTDLTGYYVRLGFEKVVMDDGKFEFVYTGTRSVPVDVSAHNPQVMVRMNVFTEV